MGLVLNLLFEYLQKTNNKNYSLNYFPEVTIKNVIQKTLKK